MRVYRSFIDDSSRWEGFEYRSDDIVVCPPSKSGTTWMLTCCAILVFGSPDCFPGGLGDFSPWLDMQFRPKAEVFARYAAQSHRRIIKTHTPLDGLPFDDRVLFIDVGRDPRDAVMSWCEQLADMDMDRAIGLRAASVGMDDLAGQPPRPLPADPAERLWVMLTDESPLPRSPVNLRALLNHHAQAWDLRARPNVAMFHYADLRADLAGQMRRLAELLGVEIDADRFPAQVSQASFDSMKGRAVQSVPENDLAIWSEPSEFFKRGRVGGWQGLLSEARLTEYDRLVASQVGPELAHWVHHGSGAAKQRPRHS
jgi:hypothetical protein